MDMTPIVFIAFVSGASAFMQAHPFLRSSSPMDNIGLRRQSVTQPLLSMQGEMSKRQFVLASLASVGAVLSGDTQAHAAGSNKNYVKFAVRIRKVQRLLDEIQRDIIEEDWEFLEGYEATLRKFVPTFTGYTDAAFPTDDPIDSSLRYALRYEVGQFYTGVRDLSAAAELKDTKKLNTAFSKMSVAYDHYLKAGNLYEDYDPLVSTENLYAGIPDNMLVYVDPKLDPPKITDQVLFIKGQDKGRTARMIGLSDGKAIVKLDLKRQGGFREIKIIPRSYVAKCVEQESDSVFDLPRSATVTFKKQ